MLAGSRATATKKKKASGTNRGNGSRVAKGDGAKGDGARSAGRAKSTQGRASSRSGSQNGKNGKAPSTRAMEELLEALTAVKEGDFSVRLPDQDKGLMGEIASTFNEIVENNGRIVDEVVRVSTAIGREGRLTERATVDFPGAWAVKIGAINSMIDDLVRPTTEVARVIDAVAEGDLSQEMALEIEGRPVKGEFLRIGTTVNSMVGQLNSFASEVTRVAKEVGTEGKLGGQARVEGVSGTWRALTDNVNLMAGNLTDQVRNIAQVTTAVAKGDLSQKITVDAKGEILELKNTINTMVDQLGSFADEVTRVAKEVGTEGKLGGQARVEDVSGTWRGLTENVNFMAGNLTDQVRNIAQVATAVAQGDLSQKITVHAKGEVATLADTINTMVDQLRSFADEVTRVAKEVGTEGKLGGQARVEGVSGTWRALTDNVNLMAGNLTDQVRNIAQVTTAVAKGDLSQKITVDARGEILELKNTINSMVDQLNSFASEVTRVAKEVGTEGKLGGQAEVQGVSGTWRGLTENVNFMAGNLTDQVRNIAQVATAVAKGDLSQKITVQARGEVATLADTINTMVDQLRSFADEVTRVAREVGTEGKLGGQAQVEGVSGTWRGLTDRVNFMAGNLTDQVRNIAQVATAVAKGDLSQKITVDAKGEILQLKNTINSMVDQLNSFASEVTRVAKEVGTEGKLGGQARVEGVSGTWKRLTDNVNQLAGNLTTQVRAIAEVSTAVTQGDLTRSITVEAQGEVAELKNNINQMIANLKATTQKNAAQDWLNTNLARISGMMQGQRDLRAVSRLIMSEVTPVVSAHHGAFFLADPGGESEPVFGLISSYGYTERKNLSNRFHVGESLVGQAALEKKSIVITEAPPDYIKISSGLGEGPPVNVIVMPVLFEEEVLAVIELASFQPFSEVHRAFLDQLTETIGVVLNTIKANMRTEELLEQSQSLAQELQSQSEELQRQQDELRRSNAELEKQAQSLKSSEELLQAQQEELQQTNEELEDKAALLAQQNRDIEIKNSEIEKSRLVLEERAEQLALSSRYKSEFLANMSHELRTPLNSLLILARLLADNTEGNLTEKQIEFAKTIHGAGNDLLELISDILDLSKIEAGRMDVKPAPVALSDVREFCERSFRPVADEKGLSFEIQISADAPSGIVTDGQRLQQVLKNLLSNAFKFTEEGGVTMRMAAAPAESRFFNDALYRADGVLAISVRDTGVGMPKEKLSLIFEAFQQADGTTSRKYGGTGLGLSISREIARLLGGEIRVDSALGAGSTFTLYLPFTYASEGEGVQEIHEAASWPAGGQGAGPPSIEAADDPTVRAPSPVPDDRHEVSHGDRVLLAVTHDTGLAQTAVEVGQEHGFKVMAVEGVEAGLAAAQEMAPDAILVDVDQVGGEGMALLDRLKSMPRTRHVPVHVVSAGEDRQRALKTGAVAFTERPPDAASLGEGLATVSRFVSEQAKRVLVVDDDEAERRAIVELIDSGDSVSITAVGSSEEALAELDANQFHCMVLDLKLPDMTGFRLLETLRQDSRFRDLPVIVHTGQDLSHEEQLELERCAETIIVKDARSPDRLLDEVTLFLHRAEDQMPTEKRRMLESLHSQEAVFQGKKILVVDDDVRNIFALTSALEAHGMEVFFAENGAEGLEALERHPDIDLVLMDVMMPGMDGYAATRAIRQMPQFAQLPIIALTAKAMKGDRDKSIESGASDYITKPVVLEQLLSLMRLWLYR